MKLGFHIPYYHDAGFIASLGEELLESGLYEWIEIKYPHDIVGFDAAPYEAAVRALVSRYDVGVSMHVPTHYDLGMWSIDVRRSILGRVRASLAFGGELGATIAAIHPGTIMHMDIPSNPASEAHERLIAAAERRKESARRLTTDALAELLPVAERLGVRLCVENVLLPEETVYSADQLLDTLGALDATSDFRPEALFDCGHAHRCGLDSADFVRRLGDRLAHVHVNDNDGSCDLHLQIGHGTIDFESMFAALHEVKFDGAVVVETSYRSADDLRTSAERLKPMM